MADPVTMVLIGSAVTSAIGIGGSMNANQESARAANKALDTQAKQNDVYFEQKKVSEYQKLNANLDRQAAIAAASGTSSRSVSLQSIQLGTARKGAQAQQNIQTEQEIARANIEAERENIKNKLAGSIFGDIGQIGQLGASFANALPRARG